MGQHGARRNVLIRVRVRFQVKARGCDLPDRTLPDPEFVSVQNQLAVRAVAGGAARQRGEADKGRRRADYVLF